MLLVPAQHNPLRTTCLPALGLMCTPDHLRTLGSSPSAPVGVWPCARSWVVRRAHPYAKEMDEAPGEGETLPDTGDTLPVIQP